MARSEFQVVVVGGGAAGIAAAARLIAAEIDTLIVEARTRLGGRSWTVSVGDGFQIDLGCGWLHSANRNPWRKIAEMEGHTIDSTVPSWTAPPAPISFPPFEEAAFMVALHSFRARLEAVREQTPDPAAGDFLEPQGRWNRLLDAVSTFYSGAALDRLSVRDFIRYEDTDINWRVLDGFGTVIAAHGADLPVKLACLVNRIDRGGRRLKVETTDGLITADAAIITLPSNLLTEATSFFSPALPEKAEAAAGLPLGLADKLFLSLSNPGEFERDTRLFGRTDRTGTGRYHFRPFGRPMIEAYFGGELAADLEAGGVSAFIDFAISELVGIFGSAFASRLDLLQTHRWGVDPYSRGSYSYALPGKAECRTTLANPVDERLFFAGEACSRSHFSTAHGAYLTGITAADQAITALRRRRS